VGSRNVNAVQGLKKAKNEIEAERVLAIELEVSHMRRKVLEDELQASQERVAVRQGKVNKVSRGLDAPSLAAKWAEETGRG
jgi:hypothetical protein